MDSFEWNKIFGAVLGTALFIQAVRIGAEFIYETPEPEQPGYAVPNVEAETPAPAESAAPAPAALPDFATAIPAADPMAGMMIAERCAACHDWTKGGPNLIGPNLYGVVDRPKASHPGYDYSPALKAKGGNWTYADLFQFLAQPAIYVPGTKMTFAGLPRTQDRLNLIAFLREQADTPAPLPPPNATP